MLKLFLLLIKLFTKDLNSGIHSIRVAFKMVNYSYIVSDLVDISIAKAFFYGLFHDVGKIGIPKRILKKKGPLTPEEFSIMKTHTINKYALFAEEYFPGICDHHETMDGKGYAGKVEDELNEYAKLLAIADVYDALSNKRAYKDAMRNEDVLVIMELMLRNGKFDKVFFRRIIEVA